MPATSPTTRTRAALIAALLVGGCVTGGFGARETIADITKGRAPGPPQRCVSTALLDNPRIVDERTIAWTRGATIYVNNLPSECPGLRPTATIVSEIYGSQQCAGDLFYTIDAPSRIPGPRCRLGEFVPYPRP